MEIWYCPVCGYGPFDEPYMSVEELRESYDICPCCGCEYGYDDNPHSFKAWRGRGARWFSPSAMPNNWQLEEQLKHHIESWPYYNHP